MGKEVKKFSLSRFCISSSINASLAVLQKLEAAKQRALCLPLSPRKAKKPNCRKITCSHHARYLFGWLLPYNYGLVKLINEQIMPVGLTDDFVVQDFGIPMKYLETAIEFFDDEVGIYPLWLCPGRCLDTGPIQAMKDDDPISIDIGIYGPCHKPNYNKVKTLRKLEKFARDYNGYQVS